MNKRIGYHYTTKNSWRHIEFHGLVIHRISKHEYTVFEEAIPNIPDHAVWVFKEELYGEELFCVLVSLAYMHNCFEMCLLEVEYSEEDGTNFLSGDEIKLSSTFSIGPYDSIKRPIDLIFKNVQPEKIRLLETWDLLSIVKGEK